MALINWPEIFKSTYDKKTCVVTGGAGFIGSHLSEALLSLGATVVVIDNLSGGSLDNVKSLPQGNGKLKIVTGSILDAQMLKEELKGAWVVFHQAALGSVPRSLREPELYYENNIVGTHRVLDAAANAGVARVVFAASSSAYGNTPTLPKFEDMPCLPRSPYAVTKVACEGILRSYAANTQLDAASLRYFNIFGPRQNANSAYAAVIAAFAKALSKGEQPIIHGDGEASRDFTFVDNAVYANLLAGASTQRIGGEVMNIACAQRVTINELAEKMAVLYGHPQIKPLHKEDRAGDVKHSLATLEKANKIIGYKPLVPFEKGLQATVAWYKTQTF